MPFLNRLPAGPGPYSLEGAPDGARPKKWILDPRWFRHLAPKELHRHHATFDHLYRHWLGRELDWEKATGILFSGDIVYDGELIDGTTDLERWQYIVSMERLLALPVRVVHGGHFPSYSGDRHRELITDWLRAKGR